MSFLLLASVERAFSGPDTVPPRLVTIDFTPKSVDVSNAPQTVTITARLADDNSGVLQADVLFNPPSGRFGLWVHFDSSNRISGNELDGIYHTVLTIPRGAEPGAWTLAVVYVDDAVFVQGASYPHLVPYPAGTPLTLFVTSATPDSIGPRLVSVGVTPTSVDVSDGPATVTLTAHLTDENSGIGWAEANVDSPGEQGLIVSLDRISGTAQDGIYQATVTIPRGSQTGTWTVPYIFLADAVSHYTTYGANGGGDFNYPAGSQVQFQVASSISDTEPPRLVSIDFTPQHLDVTSAPHTATVTAHFTDDVAGLLDAVALFKSPTSLQYQEATFDFSNRISGTAQDGIYQTTITIPRGAEPGTWKLWVVFVEDQATNPYYSETHAAQYSSDPMFRDLPFPAGTPVDLFVTDDAGQRFESEELDVRAVFAGTHVIVRDAHLSGGRGTQLKTGVAGSYVTYTVPISEPGTYHVKVGVKTGPKRGIFRLAIGGSRQGEAQDEYSPAIGYDVRDLGTVTFQAGGSKAFRFTVKGRNPNSFDFGLGLDYLELTPE